MQLVLLIGLPASGKSTLYRALFGQTHLHISKDLLKNNRRKNRRQRQLLEEAYQRGQSVVLDNTHPAREDRAPWLEWAREKGWETVGYYLSASRQECIERNQAREEAERVPDVGFFTILGRLERPHPSEGFDQLYYVRLGPDGPIVEEWREDE